MKNQDSWRKLLEKLKEKYPKRSIEELETIVRFPFKFVVEKMNNDEYTKPILINKFGTFTSTPERREKILKIVTDKANAKASGFCESLEG